MAVVEDLAEAIRADDPGTVDRLLAADPRLASGRDKDGLTPLILARSDGGRCRARGRP